MTETLHGDTGGISRRALLIGAAGAVVAAAVAVPVGITVWPRPTRIDAMLATRPFSVAHRGGSFDWPEMSAYAYERSVAAGVDALEMSVARTSDGVWIGVHDKTLDRTSDTTGFFVSEHTWAEVKRHVITPPAAHPNQPARPYWRLTDLIDTYYRTHALWVDPKAVNPRYYPELLTLMADRVPSLKDVFVAKSDASNTAWASAARAHDMQTWGFYYGSNLDRDPAMFHETEASWTLLGLDWNASEHWWQTFVKSGRPVVAHVLTTKAQRDQALQRGAHGLMIAGVSEILG